MNLMTMRFRAFAWKNNPSALSVTLERRVEETALPYRGSRLEDLGQAKRKIRGEGYFAGEDRWEQWSSLEEEFRKGGPGCLQLPGLPPFLAVLDSLDLLGDPGAGPVRYKFSFTEYRAAAPYEGRGWHQAQAGESLWDYAWRYGKTVEELARANPQIRDVAVLEEGQEVWIP